MLHYKKRIIRSILVLVLLFLSTAVHAQRIIGYYPDYAYTAASANNIQYAKLTHLYYFAINPTRTTTGQSAGALGYNDVWFTTARFNDVIAKARAANPAIKICIVTGGMPGSDWDLSDRLEYIGSNPAILNTFLDNIISFITTHNLDGWDLDWEFPRTASARTAHENMLVAMRIKIDALKTSSCKHYELTIAVGGGYTDLTSPRECWGESHTEFITQNAVNALDFMNIMSYDGPVGAAPCSFSSQQHYDLFVKSFNDWRATVSIPASKINMGVGFYDNSGTAFNSIGNVNTRYNATYWNGGSGCPNMQSKINFTRAQGAAGVFIWELIQDNLCAGTTPSCYSLLDCMYQYTQSTWGTWVSPGNPCSLPVTLLQFTGRNNGTSRMLNWTTATEKDNERFDIEKSFDGKSFETIGSIPGNDNSNTAIHYEYTDHSNSNGTVYYRLNQHDFDGTSSRSSIISISSSIATHTIYPNPFEDFFEITCPSDEETTARIIFSDLSGRILSDELLNTNAGKIQTGHALPAGVFLCTLVTSNTTLSLRVVKTKQ
ncbi:MAG: hypothetical protein K0R51_256 [Cytophagaceae bacterium]|jgi:GH18 family chitinase|nr:hypothetical protein [Cytophagaceae bacterium]